MYRHHTKWLGFLFPLQIGFRGQFFSQNLISHSDIMKEGIFRIPGRATNILEMKISYEQGNGLNIENPDTHDVAGLLAQFFRELPEPLLTDELYDDWVIAVKRDEGEMIAELAYLVRRLPEANINILKYFIEFLAAIAKHSGANRMGARNLALVFGASLLNPPPEKYDLEGIKAQCTVVENMITHYEEIFEGKHTQPAHFKANRQKTVATIPAGPSSGSKPMTGLPQKKPLRKRKGFFLSAQYSVNSALMQNRAAPADMEQSQQALSLSDIGRDAQSVTLPSTVPATESSLAEEKKRKKRTDRDRTKKKKKKKRKDSTKEDDEETLDEEEK
jgi:hypothetical protein